MSPMPSRTVFVIVLAAAGIALLVLSRGATTVNALGGRMTGVANMPLFLVGLALLLVPGLLMLAVWARGRQATA